MSSIEKSNKPNDSNFAEHDFGDLKLNKKFEISLFLNS